MARRPRRRPARPGLDRDSRPGRWPEAGRSRARARSRERRPRVLARLRPVSGGPVGPAGRRQVRKARRSVTVWQPFVASCPSWWPYVIRKAAW